MKVLSKGSNAKGRAIKPAIGRQDTLRVSELGVKYWHLMASEGPSDFRSTLVAHDFGLFPSLNFHLLGPCPPEVTQSGFLHCLRFREIRGIGTESAKENPLNTGQEQIVTVPCPPPGPQLGGKFPTPSSELLPAIRRKPPLVGSPPRQQHHSTAHPQRASNRPDAI